jgi:hypothetical protein
MPGKKINAGKRQATIGGQQSEFGVEATNSSTVCMPTAKELSANEAFLL